MMLTCSYTEVYFEANSVAAPVTAAAPLHSRYLNAIQTMCPHILRYLTTAVITNKDVRKRRQVLKDLVKVIQQVRPVVVGRTIPPSEAGGFSHVTNKCLPQESYTYRDPITEFVECLYVNFDFDSAQKKLRECESVRVDSQSFSVGFPA